MFGRSIGSHLSGSASAAVVEVVAEKQKRLIMLYRFVCDYSRGIQNAYTMLHSY